MTTVLITSPAGQTVGALALPAEIFDAPSNIPLMHQVVVAQLAAARAGTHATLTRGEVSGGGRKPYRQKGTGRARQGSIRAPQFTGGGIAHGPVPHRYLQRTPKKMKAAALRGALSDRARGGNVHVLSAVIDGDVPSTKAAAATLASIELRRNVLVVVSRADEAGTKSLRNLPIVHLLPADQLNTYDVLRSDDVVFTRAALDEFLEFCGSASAAEADVPAGAVTHEAAAPAKPNLPRAGAKHAAPDDVEADADGVEPSMPQDSADPAAPGDDEASDASTVIVESPGDGTAADEASDAGTDEEDSK